MRFMLQRSNNEDWKLFVRYVAGECSEREAAQVRSAIASDESKARLLDVVQQLSDDAKRLIPPVDTDVAWTRLDDRIREDARIRPLRIVDRPSAIVREPRARPTHFFMARAAAVLLMTMLMATAGVMLLKPLMSPQRVLELPVAKEQEIVTRRAQRATIRLADGTLVYMNAESKLTVPEPFESDRREVRLDGEAYFDVARDTTRPFLVITPQASIEVLGTAFNVSAYPGEGRTQVAVVEGSVSVRSERPALGDTLLLRPHDVGIVAGDDEPVARRNVDIDHLLAWREGRLVFRNASFREVESQLERFYNIEIELVGSPASRGGLIASFDDEPMVEVLQSIATALNLRLVRDEKKATFFATPSEGP